MHYVIIGEHSAEVCPSSNAKTKALLLEVGPQIPKIAEQNGVTIVAGPFVNREHITVVVVESERAEAVDDFLMQARLPQVDFVAGDPVPHHGGRHEGDYRGGISLLIHISELTALDV